MSDYVLEILDGERAGEVVSLGRERFTLGRRPGNDIVVNDEKASGNHAEVVHEGDAWVLRDLQSRNGTFLDGRKVTEVSLSPGDTFHIGLTKVRFRRASDPPAALTAGDDPGLTVHQVDQARLQRVRGGGGGILGMLVALLLLAGAGAWVWLQYGGGGDPERPRGQAKPVAIPGNLLAHEAATLDSDAAWDLGAAGVTWSVGGPARSGANALSVTRGDGVAFALARLREPLKVIAEESLFCRAQVRTEQGASVGLRLRFSSSREDGGQLTASVTPRAAEDWDQLEGAFAVPPGMDRVQIEVVALLPGATATASVDDIALVKGGAATAVQLLARNGVRLAGTGSAIAMVAGSEVLVQALRPLIPVGSPLAALDAAARATLADGGGDVRTSVKDDRFTLVPAGVGVALEVPGPDGLLLRDGDAPFAASPAEFEATATDLLVGAGVGRLMLTLPAGTKVKGMSVAGGYRLVVPGAVEFGVVVAFEEQRGQARDRVREARADVQAGRFAQALARLQEVAERYPHDDAVAGEAQQLRAEITQGLSGKLDRLEQDLDTAQFFTARSGLVRVLADLDGLVSAYGEANLGRAELVKRVRETAGKSIADLDAQAITQRADGLRKLADAFQTAGQDEVAKLIQGYLAQHERKN
jgi:hypothetical protein